MKEKKDYTNRHKKPKGIKNLVSLFYTLAIANTCLGFVSESLRKSGLMK